MVKVKNVEVTHINQLFAKCPTKLEMFNNNKFFIKYLGSFTYLLSGIENVVQRSVISQIHWVICLVLHYLGNYIKLMVLIGDSAKAD